MLVVVAAADLAHIKPSTRLVLLLTGRRWNPTVTCLSTMMEGWIETVVVKIHPRANPLILWILILPSILEVIQDLGGVVEDHLIVLLPTKSARLFHPLELVKKIRRREFLVHCINYIIDHQTLHTFQISDVTVMLGAALVVAAADIVISSLVGIGSMAIVIDTIGDPWVVPITNVGEILCQETFQSTVVDLIEEGVVVLDEKLLEMIATTEIEVKAARLSPVLLPTIYPLMKSGRSPRLTSLGRIGVISISYE